MDTVVYNKSEHLSIKQCADNFNLQLLYWFTLSAFNHHFDLKMHV